MDHQPDPNSWWGSVTQLYEEDDASSEGEIGSKHDLQSLNEDDGRNETIRKSKQFNANTSYENFKFTLRIEFALVDFIK
ncbi:hypothetical protein PanWU01x14_004910 [Parasponia andersonii]|uniref:Uncharacterized protein n=1 Tax=Parasponia andersonii TaxID=3476 RepID=A0A2P5E3C7_PARAD|nr:hypothetical protein PanWU01x14_004910 [Parasponia andersonii]